MLALYGEHHCPNTVRPVGKERLDAGHRGTVGRIALLRARQREHGDGTVALGA